jgi:hypothetical protein
MECEEAHCLILLADSSELLPLKAAELETHLSSCANCRLYRDIATDLISCARKHLPADGPDEVVLARIRTAAQEQISGAGLEFRHTIVQLLAYAAVLALLVGGWFLLSTTKQPAGRDNHPDTAASAKSEQIGHINTIANALSEFSYNQEQELNEQQNGATKKQNINELAHQLLILEGLASEDATDDEVIVPDVELLPTDLRSSNTSGLLSKECV